MGLGHGRGHRLTLCDFRRSSGSRGWEQQKDMKKDLSVMGGPAVGCAILRGFDFTTLGL